MIINIARDAFDAFKAWAKKRPTADIHLQFKNAGCDTSGTAQNNAADAPIDLQHYMARAASELGI